MRERRGEPGLAMVLPVGPYLFCSQKGQAVGLGEMSTWIYSLLKSVGKVPLKAPELGLLFPSFLILS